MTLIIVLIGMAFEHFAGVSDDLRRFNWFQDYAQWLENRLSGSSIWNGVMGVIMTLFAPLLITGLITWLLATFFVPLALLFALVVLIYCLGPRYLNPQLNELIEALEEGDARRIQEQMSAFSPDTTALQNDQSLLENILLEANRRLFGVLFWFIVLGPLGAVLYRLSCILQQQQSGIHGGYADSVRDLYNILNWLPARLFAIGNAVTGNMVDAMEAWREVEQRSLTANDDVIKASGLGSLSYEAPEYTDDDTLLEDKIYWLRAVQGLLNRTLLAWLSILGLMTLSGWMG